MLKAPFFLDARTWEVLCGIKDIDWTDPDIGFILSNLNIESFEANDIQICLQYFVDNASLSESSFVRIFREKLDARATELLSQHLEKSEMLTLAGQWVKIYQVSEESFRNCQYLQKFIRRVIFHEVTFRKIC
jgi:hypothetical protein